MALSAGTRLGPYEIIGFLGAGGMGEVYRARDPRLQREVAIKILPPALTSDSDRRSRFEQEARAAGSLNHPNIVAVFDIGSENGALYIVQELLEGENLRDRLKHGAMPLRKTLDYAVQAARGLAAAHVKGIVHRDLKPENLFLSADGRLKILDFGLAKLAGSKGAAADVTSAPTELLGTQPGIVVGTVGYMSPEQVRGQAVDHRSDVFALGCIFFEMLTGKRAFQADSPADTMSAILREDPPELAAINPNLPAALDRIVRHCLEKSPAERFQSAQDLAFQLESLSSASSATQAARALPPSRRKPLLMAAAVVASLLAGLGFGRVVYRNSGPDLSRYKFTALATEEGVKHEAAWSPDGKTIAYTGTVEGVFQVFTRALDQPVPTQITHGTRGCRYPFWSPDGSRLYFLSGGALWDVGAAGGTPEKRAEDVRSADISPDGKTLAIGRRDAGGLSIWIQPSGGGEARRLGGVLTGQEIYLRFAPGGGSIGVMTAIGEGALVFWSVGYPDGAARKAIVTRSITLGVTLPMFGWFPDGRHVVFAASPSLTGRNRLTVGDTANGTVRLLTAGLNDEEDAALSPDGKRIAFTRAEQDQDIVELPLDGSPMRTVLATSLAEHCAAWSPKGDQFVYSKEVNGTNEVWVHSVREGGERPLVTAAAFREGHTDRLSEARYSPDGQRVVFVRVSDGRYWLWVVSAQGGSPVPLGVEGAMAAWSPDGNWLVYEQASGFGVMKVSSGGGGKPVRLAGPGVVLRPQWSPRGDWITWREEKALKLVSPDGAKNEVLSEEGGWQQMAGFSPDGATVYAARTDERHHLMLEAIEIVSKRRRVISDLGLQDGLHGFSLAPDGKSILTTLDKSRGDIWLLEGFPQP
jgi:serine/threonine protein kinase/Tol biopolymer transport system component